MIRRATPADLAAIVALGPFMMTQTLLAVDHAKAAREVHRTLELGEAFVATGDGEVVGSVGFQVGEAWYSSQKLMMDKWLAVRPTHRRGILAGKLLLALEGEAKALGLPLFFGVSGDSSNNKVFERRYRRVAVQYKKEI